MPERRFVVAGILAASTLLAGSASAAATGGCTALAEGPFVVCRGEKVDIEVYRVDPRTGRAELVDALDIDIERRGYGDELLLPRHLEIESD